MPILTRRVYEEPHRGDGQRVLVDRLWPRGLSKDKAALDEWLPTLAPSNELRKWFAHDGAKWAEFRRRYFAELDAARAASGDAGATLRALRAAAKRGRLTLLFGTRELECNNAVALAEYLSRPESGGRTSVAKIR